MAKSIYTNLFMNRFNLANEIFVCIFPGVLDSYTYDPLVCL